MSTPPYSVNGRSQTNPSNPIKFQFGRYWFFLLSLLLAIFVGLPWLAPLFMQIGWVAPAKAIYFFYSIQCHQMPQRSFFLFGQQVMYNLPDIQSGWQDSSNPLILRQFVGNASMGWKVAWSDRMVYMYTSVFLMGLIYWPWRRRIKPLPWWGLLLFLLPMALDGFSHMLSDISGGIGGGFRYHNNWLAVLTSNVFPATFYSGDALGSFNSWMRLLSGLFFGIGLVWFAYPRLHTAVVQNTQQIEPERLQTGQKS